MDLNAGDILGPNGRLAKRLAPDYEVRPQQLRMAEGVTDALQRQEHLIVEAGTGTGKSFGYLVPAILHATEREGNDEGRTRRIVISTHTISLQEQLILKDLPLLNSVIPREFSAVLVKGRSNYLSLRRLDNARQRSRNLFDNPDQLEQLGTITAWANQTDDGSQADLSFRPSPALWDEVGSDTSNCMGRNCASYDQCFYYRARRRSQHAQILVVNHALFFSDLALRQHNASVIPDYDAVIFDEAHNIEAVASDHLGMRLTSGQVDYNLRRLFNDSRNTGLLVDGTGRSARLQKLVMDCRDAADGLFGELNYWYESQGQGFNGRVREARPIANPLSPLLAEFSMGVKRHANQCDDESKRKDLQAAAERILALGQALDGWLAQSSADHVFWMERTFDRQSVPRFKLAAAPLDIGETLRTQLFQSVPSVVMTSATLATGRDDFSFYQSRLGVTQTNTLQVGSPFDYARQAKVIVVDDIPDPSAARQDYERMLATAIERLTISTDGSAFALFTSYDLMRKVAARIAPGLRSAGIAMLSQADGTPRHLLLEQFQAQSRAVLLGADSFWQGVDVPGDALRNVMITKLPFSVPNQPLRQARMDAIREAGGNPFNDLLLPEAIIKFRQGFGRLIRSRRDSGIVVVLDPRIVNKQYGPQFLHALPECPVDVVGSVELFDRKET